MKIKTETQLALELLGWKKGRIAFEKKLEENEYSEIVSSNGKNYYATKLDPLSYEEALLVTKVIDVFRKETHEYNEKFVEELIVEYCDQNSLLIEPFHVKKIAKYVDMEVRGLSILDTFVKDPDLEEIAVLNDKKPIYVYHKRFGWLESDIFITSDKKIKNIINKISRDLGRRITLQKPRINANLKLGRMHAAILPIAFSGSCITIRKFNQKPFSPTELVKNGTVSSEAMAFLWLAILSDSNVLVVGNTGSGKTSTLNSLFQFVPQNERVIVVEETPEISLPHENQIKLSVNPELNISMHELVTDTLRMRPDRIIVGEVRDEKEVKALINTMLAGQGKSSFATFHGQNSNEALIRMLGLGINPHDIYALDLIVVQRRWTDQKSGVEKRRVTEIAAVKKDYSEKPKLEIIYEYDRKQDSLVKKMLFQNHIYSKICDSFGFDKSGFKKEIMKRQKILENQYELH